MADTDNIDLQIDGTTASNEPQLLGTEATAKSTVTEPSSWTKILLQIAFFIPNLLFLNSLKENSMYNIWLFLLWTCIGIIIYTTTFGIDASQTIFTLYCCSVWIIALAIIFLCNV